MSTRSGRIYQVREAPEEMANMEGASQAFVTELFTRLLEVCNKDINESVHTISILTYTSSNCISVQP